MKRKYVSLSFLIIAVIVIFTGIYHNKKPLPEGVSVLYPERSIAGDSIKWFFDNTYIDEGGERVSEQEIFSALYRAIENAEQLIVIDMFFFSDFIGSLDSPYLELASELTDRLVAKKERSPSTDIVFITDNVNTLYGGFTPEHFTDLKEAGIRLLITDTTMLRDSNPLYSGIWRVLIQPFGISEGGIFTNAMDARMPKVGLRSYLKSLNFKANHRKVMISDYRDEQDILRLASFITSANPHDGSARNSNVAVRLDNNSSFDLLRSENALLKLHGEPVVETDAVSYREDEVSATVQVVTEGMIEDTLIGDIESTQEGDRIDMLMFYFADRDIVRALKRASDRGVEMRFILDPNKDSFGREKSGIPNRQVGYELDNHHENIQIRWCNTTGEQCHSKVTIITRSNRTTISHGSANLTKRNIGNYNLETNVLIRARDGDESVEPMISEFEKQWSNESDIYTLPFEAYEDSAITRILRYRIQEFTGFGSF